MSFNYASIELLMIKLFLKRFLKRSYLLLGMNFVFFLKLSEILFLAGNSVIPLEIALLIGTDRCFSKTRSLIVTRLAPSLSFIVI